MDTNRETFSYSYSAKQQQEVENIRQKYLPREETKLEQLRRLDRKATKKGMAVSIAAGIIGSLLLGLGMCCTMVWADTLFYPGIAVGLAGIALVAAAYPLYTRITGRERKKIAPEILRLADELSQK